VTSLLNSKSVAPNDAEINNSISGIIGSLPPGPGQG
jgi:hypothetical protein